MCESGQCILEADLCNGVRDCEDGSDEPQGYCLFNDDKGKVFKSGFPLVRYECPTFSTKVINDFL